MVHRAMPIQAVPIQIPIIIDLIECSRSCLQARSLYTGGTDQFDANFNMLKINLFALLESVLPIYATCFASPLHEELQPYIDCMKYATTQWHRMEEIHEIIDELYNRFIQLCELINTDQNMNMYIDHYRQYVLQIQVVQCGSL